MNLHKHETPKRCFKKKKFCLYWYIFLCLRISFAMCFLHFLDERWHHQLKSYISLFLQLRKLCSHLSQFPCRCFLKFGHQACRPILPDGGRTFWFDNFKWFCVNCSHSYDVPIKPGKQLACSFLHSFFLMRTRPQKWDYLLLFVIITYKLFRINCKCLVSWLLCY